MSIELKDLRAKITPETWCWLEALSRATGEDQQTIVRNVLDRWARQHLSASSIAANLMRAEGVAGNDREGGGL